MREARLLRPERGSEPNCRKQRRAEILQTAASYADGTEPLGKKDEFLERHSLLGGIGKNRKYEQTGYQSVN